jgi:nucleotide-binding universal stress UspA family protein
MRIMATFDGSTCSESILVELEKLACIPELEVVLLSSVATPRGRRARVRPLRPDPGIVALDAMHPILVGSLPQPVAERKDQAVERRLSEVREYLLGIAARLPQGPKYVIETHVTDHPGAKIVQRALALRPDMIVMATHGATGVIHHIFGDVVEEVMRSGVASVLVVPPGGAGHDHPSWPALN